MSSDKLLKELITECMSELNEGMRLTGTIRICGGKEVPIGSEEHVNDLKRTLEGMENVKSHWGRGSSNRFVISTACSRLKKLILKLSGPDTE